MKKIIFALTLFTVFNSAAFAARNDADKKLLNDLSIVFKNAENIKWTSTDKFNKAVFYFNEQAVSAFYNLDGELIGYFIHQNVLAKEITDAIPQKYKDWKITEAEKFIDADGNVKYFIQVQNIKHDLILEIASYGKATIFMNLR